MNGAHLHLVVNHLPVVGFLFATPALMWAMWKNNRGAIILALTMVLASGLFSVAADLTGDGAEHILTEVLPGGSSFKDAIHNHEEAADIAWVVGCVASLGAAACLTMLIIGKDKFLNHLLKSTLLISICAAVAMGWVANLGGKIRHPEISMDDLPAK